MDRVTVFFGYQNVAGWAKRCFNTNEGHIWPKKTAELLVSRRQRPSELVETRVYRGRPNPTRQAVSARANDRQAADWETTGVTVVRRNLRYPPQWPSQPAAEKGIDAAMVSTSDKDILPAIELVYADTPCHVGLACWSGGRRLRFEGTQAPWCHFLKESDFLSVRDLTDYTAPNLARMYQPSTGVSSFGDAGVPESRHAWSAAARLALAFVQLVASTARMKPATSSVRGNETGRASFAGYSGRGVQKVLGEVATVDLGDLRSAQSGTAGKYEDRASALVCVSQGSGVDDLRGRDAVRRLTGRLIAGEEPPATRTKNSCTDWQGVPRFGRPPLRASSTARTPYWRCRRG